MDVKKVLILVAVLGLLFAAARYFNPVHSTEVFVDLAEGADVENGTGWTATAPRASIDLKSEVIMAEEASLAGPGFTVEGRNLRWWWEDSSKKECGLHVTPGK